MAEPNGKVKFDEDLGCSINATIKTAQFPKCNDCQIGAKTDLPKHVATVTKPARSSKFRQTVINKLKSITSRVFSAKKTSHTTGNGEVPENRAELAQQKLPNAEAAEVLSTQSSNLSNLTEGDIASEASHAESLVGIVDEAVVDVLGCELGAAPAEKDRLRDVDRDVQKLLRGQVLKVNHAHPVPMRFQSFADVTDPCCNPAKPIQISHDDVAAAAVVLSRYLVRTSCSVSVQSQFAKQISLTDTRSHIIIVQRCIAAENYAFDLYFKKELELHTCSFNERGACYALVSLPKDTQKRGVISASWGDQAQGLSYNGWKLNIPVTVVMPRCTPIRKVQKCRSFNARVILDGNNFDEAEAIAMRVGNQEGLVYINGYDHPHIIAGQGTMALEILEQVPNPDAVVIPVGGGSMISGVSAVFRTLSPDTKVIGVESEMCVSFTHAILKNGPVFTPPKDSLADVLSVPKVGSNAFVTAVPCIDRMVAVDEEWIALAILRLVEEEKCVVDGAGAAPMAALLAGHLDDLKGKKVVLVLSGGNIDSTDIGRVLERGLANEGRLVKFDVLVRDEHNGINRLCELLKKVGVAILDIKHEPVWQKDTCTVKVKVVCETCHWPHSIALKNALENEYEHVEFSKKPLTLHSKTSEQKLYEIK